MEVGKSQGGFITSPKANTVQLHSVTGSRRAERGSKKRGGGWEPHSNPALHPFVTWANTRVAGRHAIGQQPVLYRFC